MFVAFSSKGKLSQVDLRKALFALWKKLSLMVSVEFSMSMAPPRLASLPALSGSVYNSGRQFRPSRAGRSTYIFRPQRQAVA